MKKKICFVLTILLLVFYFPGIGHRMEGLIVNAKEEPAVVSSGKSGIFSYNVLSDSTIVITNCDDKETDLVIPSEMNGLKVSQLGKYDGTGKRNGRNDRENNCSGKCGRTGS